ncbi:unnamed protein product [Heterobilharzia americana]|nr:unnamed protein product [Heterobilharzia americana]
MLTCRPIGRSLFSFLLVVIEIHCSFCQPTFDTECGSTALLFSSNGNIFSHKGYEKQLKYDGLIQCFWLINTLPDRRIIVQSVNFDLAGNSTECDEDSLMAYEPNETFFSNNSSDISAFTKKVGDKAYCGSENFRLLSNSNQLLLVFKGRSSGRHRGFNLRYATVPTAFARQIEQSLMSSSQDDTCDSSFEWKCSNSHCVLKKWRCDGYADCPGSEDEINCFHLSSLKSQRNRRQKRAVDDEDDWGRVVNGQPAAQGAWPFIVSLRFSANGGHVCGGSLISKQWVMTAAHCVQLMPDPKNWYVDIGRYYKNTNGPEIQRIKVDQVHIYPSYNRITYANVLPY